MQFFQVGDVMELWQVVDPRNRHKCSQTPHPLVQCGAEVWSSSAQEAAQHTHLDCMVTVFSHYHYDLVFFCYSILIILTIIIYHNYLKYFVICTLCIKNALFSQLYVSIHR